MHFKIVSDTIIKKGDPKARGNAKIEYRDGYRAEQVRNQRPNTEYNDCAVRAMAIAFDMPYAKAAELLCVHTGRQRQQGTNNYRLCCMLRNETLMASLGYRVTDVKAGAGYATNDVDSRHDMCSDWWVANRRDTGTMPLLRYALRQPKGRHFLLVKNHALAMVDQTVFDNRDRSTGRHKLMQAFQIEKI